MREALGYVWAVPLLGGCPVGARADRSDLLEFRSRRLGGIGVADRGARSVPVLPARFATVGVFLDRRTRSVVSLVGFHLVPGVQLAGAYRGDRPRLALRHRSEAAALSRVVEEELVLGRVVYAIGDSSFDGMWIAGLTSCRLGREDGPGTLGSARKIDDVFGPGRADAVRLLQTPSDHQAVLTRWP
ncbi:hypothetical protein BH10ACT10_BH10ACT10_10130 [soil metagenome]